MRPESHHFQPSGAQTDPVPFQIPLALFVKKILNSLYIGREPTASPSLEYLFDEKPRPKGGVCFWAVSVGAAREARLRQRVASDCTRWSPAIAGRIGLHTQSNRGTTDDRRRASAFVRSWIVDPNHDAIFVSGDIGYRATVVRYARIADGSLDLRRSCPISSLDLPVPRHPMCRW